MTISVMPLRALFHEMSRRGHDVARLCEEVGLDPATLEDAGARVSFDVHNAAVGRALELTREPQLGLYVGSGASPSIAMLLGGLVTSSPTLREAARVHADYAALGVEGIRWDVSERDGIASLACTLPEALVHQAYDREASMAIAYTFLRFSGGNEAPLEVCFAHAPTGPREVYRRVFDCDVRFEAGENAIRSHASVLDRRQLHADADLNALLRQRADLLLDDLRRGGDLRARVRAYVRALPRPIEVRTDELARGLGLGGRALRRRLAREGTTLRAELEGAFTELACAALRDPATSIKEASFQLGFTQISAFYRAFRRWTGVTPATYRERAASALRAEPRRSPR